ncbi:TspO/MBR family protein [Stakelama saccharophila]|uniref:TspO/MBR family protein n=1 Tax=Stakelama saccharophila TaxID=3075605 RepID=A0ABZ0B883_9SPHN|nr:TspO/MBR family protein [Stakelama sp. W311]WNO53230.1 TspO/MBR family protein [Stakelama sp. W311]
MSLVRWILVIMPAILLLGFLSASLVPVGADSRWYSALAKPDATPPAWLFPVAWTTIYILIGLALALIVNARRARGRGVGIALFAVQMAANLAWMPLFFGAHAVVPSILLLAILLLLVIAMAFAFARVRPLAAWLLVPYMVWVSYAGIILLEIHALNPNAGDLVIPAPTTQIAL